MYGVKFWSELLSKFVFKQYDDLNDALFCANETGGKVFSVSEEQR